MLRDFIYLDTERLRSFTAQLLGGVPETAAVERGHEAGGQVSGEAGLWRFVRAQGELDYRYHRAASETRSLHHHVYSLFEEALASDGLLTTVDASFDYASRWQPEHLQEATFVKLIGQVRLVDYGIALSFMEGYASLAKAFKVVQSLNVRNEQAAGTTTARDATAALNMLAELENSAKALPTNQLAHLARTVFKPDAIRVKVRPEGAAEDQVAVGYGNTESLFLELGAGGLLQSPSSASWVAVGQISAPDSDELAKLTTGNGVEDSVDTMSAMMRELIATGTGIAFPGVGLTPLAIYRTVGAPAK